MQVKHFLSISELDPDQLAFLINDALVFAGGERDRERPLCGRAVGVYFRVPSTRTRTAFTVGALKLGAHTIQYGPNDLQVVTGESTEDTARVLSNFLDVLVFRSNRSIEEMRKLAGQDSMAVINAMSDNEHPSQSVADLVTIKEAFGRLNDLHVMYIGEGNNTASALALAIARTPSMQLTLVTPRGYGLPDPVVSAAQETAKAQATVIEQIHDLGKLPRGVDVVYTTRWQTMGEPKTEPDWQECFRPYSVTREMMAEVSKPSGTVFMHDLPAVRGSDVVDEVLDGPQSIAFRQAFHKMTSAMAILSWCLNGKR